MTTMTMSTGLLAIALQMRAGDAGPQSIPVQAVDVVAEGADPTGARDSARAFQDAIATGRTVWVSPGRYLFLRAVVLASGTVIEARPGSATLVADPQNVGAGGAFLMTGTGVHDVAVRGLVFDGNRAARHDPAAWKTRLVYIDGGTRVVFGFDAWRDGDGSALVFSGVAAPIVESGVRSSTFSDLGFAWRSPGDGTLRETAPVIVFANGSVGTNRDDFVSDNHVFNVGSDAVSVQQQTRFVAERNELDLAQAGWKPTTVAHAVTYGIGGFYVFQKNGELPNDDVLLRDNSVRGATGNCFDLVAIGNLRIVGNSATYCGGAGISIGSGVRNFMVSKNTLTYNFQSRTYPYPNRTHVGSLTFGCGRQPCSGVVTDGTVSDNTFGDGGLRTQPVDAWCESGLSLRDVRSDVTIVHE